MGSIGMHHRCLRTAFLQFVGCPDATALKGQACQSRTCRAALDIVLIECRRERKLPVAKGIVCRQRKHLHVQLGVQVVLRPDTFDRSLGMDVRPQHVERRLQQPSFNGAHDIVRVVFTFEIAFGKLVVKPLIGY